MRTRLFLSLCALVFIMTVVVAASAGSHSGDISPRPRMLDDGPPPLLPGKDWSAEPVKSAPSAPMYPWSAVVFESYRNSNWDIYAANDDGSQLRRLSSHAATDMQPRLNQGVTAIAFASNRTGTYEIYVMNADGTGLKQLTYNSVNDTWPTWSPDGSQIAFQSFRDGNWEIYLMNADGSNQQRLTNSAEYQGQPAFSPDGQKLAYVDGSVGNRIWVMNADGSVQRQLSNQEYSYSPAWSPDGALIAYDADGDQDGWQEVWLMNADGSSQNRIYTPPGSQVDVYVSGFGPAGNYINFDAVQWIYYEGDWYWMTAIVQRVETTGGGLAQMVSGDTNGSLDWQTKDNTPPRSSLGSLPAYSRSQTTLRWTAEDVGGSGIRSVEIEYKHDFDTEWTPWQELEGESGDLELTLPSGSRYEFRSRSVDNAYNYEAWSDTLQTVNTMLYDWGMKGNVSSNRGGPVSGAEVASVPSSYANLSSNDDGEYSAYFAGEQSEFDYRLTKAGYDTLPWTTFSTTADISMDVVLPPLDNVVADGGFEDGSLNGPWRSDGVYPSDLVDTYRHTGNNGLQLNAPFQFTAIRPSVECTADRSDFLIDGSGKLHAYFIENSTDYDICYLRSSNGIAWEAFSGIAAGDDVRGLVWGAGNDGALHLVWTRQGPSMELVHAWFDPTGNQHTAVVIYQSSFIDLRQLAVDDDGRVHLIFRPGDIWSNDEMYIYFEPGSGWSRPISTGLRGENVVDHMVVGDDGRLHILYRFSGDSIFYAYLQPNGHFSSGELVYPGGYNWHQRMVVDTNGKVHILWQNVSQSKMLHRARDVQGGWSGIKLLSQEFWDDRFEAATASDGSVHFAWLEGVDYSCHKVSYAWISGSGQWHEPVVIDSGLPCQYDLEMHSTHEQVFLVTKGGGYYSTHICRVDLSGLHGASNPLCSDIGHETVGIVTTVDSEGRLFWLNRSMLEAEIGVPALASESDAAEIAQAISVTHSISDPTLSFMVDVGGGSGGNGSRFEVSVADSLTTTVVYTSGVTSGWQHEWVDMTPWSGQQVTVTFSAVQVAGDFESWAFLDEVSLGSAYPDSWVALAGPASLPSDEQVVYELTYGNRGGVDGYTGTLTVTLPAGVSFSGAVPAPDVTADSLVWSLGDLPAGDGLYTIIISGTVAADVIVGQILEANAEISLSGTELELLNNAAVYRAPAGRVVMLPVVLRD